MRKLILLTYLLFSISIVSMSQSWYEMRENGENFYKVRQAYDSAFAQSQNQRVNKPFERWAHRMNEITWPSGEIHGNVPNYFLLKKEMANKARRAKASAYPQWTNMGPDIAVEGYGNGRLNFIKFRPDSLDVIFVGAPAGGLWKSTDGGQVFKLINDTLPVLGCSDLAIDPINTDIMYLATGDRDASDTYSIGILKSFDGGLTWDTTGLQWSPTIQRTIGRLDINPQNPQMILAATNVGLYLSEDGGNTWAIKKTGNFKDVHFKPGDSSTFYISGAYVFVTYDAGETFVNANLSGPFSRIELAVSEDDPNYVYALGAQTFNLGTGLESLWRSTDSGQSWTKRYDGDTDLNILGWDAGGLGSGGQGWYDLALAVSPEDKNNVVVGGINVWQSFNGGSDFGNGAKTGLHVDQHDIVFKPNSSDIYAANDGGIYYYPENGLVWVNLTNTLQVTQSYRLGISHSTPGIFQMGNQDNGTFRRLTNGSFTREYGSDGMETIIDHTNDAVRYAATQNGPIFRSVNGAVYQPIIPNSQSIFNSDFSGAWETPYIMDPYQNNILYVGYTHIYKTNNANATNSTSITWDKRNNSSYPSGGKTSQLVIAPWNLDMLMAAKGSSLYVSSDGGENWSFISGPLPNNFITNIQFSPFFNFGTFTAYVTLSGYSSGNKVFRTVDAGQTWQNISAGIPNVPAHCIVIDPTTINSEELYVGTDIGVFYKNDNMTEFEPYSNGLPNVWVQEMEVQVSEGYIYACTYGRGSWKVPLYSTIVGLEQEQLAKNNSVDLSVYPNPFENSLEIKYDLKAEKEVQLELIDLQGRVIYSYENSNPQLGLNYINIDSEITELKAGMYILKFRTGDEEITEKVIRK